MTLDTYDTCMTYDTAIATVDGHGLSNAAHCEFHKVMLRINRSLPLRGVPY